MTFSQGHICKVTIPNSTHITKICVRFFIPYCHVAFGKYFTQSYYDPVSGSYCQGEGNSLHLAKITLNFTGNLHGDDTLHNCP